MNVVPPAALRGMVRYGISQGTTGCLMGLDVGTRWVGVAVTDRKCQLASPLLTLEREKGARGKAPLQRVPPPPRANARILNPLTMYTRPHTLTHCRRRRRLPPSPLTCTTFLGKFGKTAAHIRSLVSNHAVCGFVVGWPLELSGKEGIMCDRVRGFLASLQAAEAGSGGGADGGSSSINLAALPAVLWDERFSSLEARSSLSEFKIGDMRAPKYKKATDRVAAALILQSFLDDRSDDVADD
jgi:RNase H-fold protein (predicted Holliday junction resolvase)